ncbi:hypothetical protein QBZ16_003083 [Prototheca wickerhamii]|uniref:Uncharacterized protein n=1 Tax=Prototheca wickerhamii TaxID=3111 RepID=A0AAD9INP3_PROWI|nr:hypothetical protein QBZ16_003083 [Prototheca wickerhamii]
MELAKEPKSAKKEKKEKASKKAEPTTVVAEDSVAEEAVAAYKRDHVCAIAKPLASEKLTKKVLKLAKKAAKRKQIKRGVKEEELGAAGLTKRPTSCMLVLPKAPKGKAAPADDDDFESSYDEVVTQVKAVQPIF